MIAGPYTLKAVMIVGATPASVRLLADSVGVYAQNVLTAESTPLALCEARRNPAELVIVLEDIPADEALRFVAEMHATARQTRVAVLARRPTVAQAVEFVKAGACDYLTAPLDSDALRRLIALAGARPESPSAGRERFFSSECPPGVAFVGRSPAAAECLRKLRLVAQSRCNPILLTGQTGTGKEVAAQAVHAWRCGQPDKFVAVNCAALTANLLESELFGHVRGAFTGADRDKTGLLELAGDGTVFLDEISEMPLALQAKLLRVLQERTFRKVGGTKEQPCQATILASSNRDLLAAVRDGTFRGDLYYRLAVLPIDLAPLSHPERRADILLLAEWFLANSDVCPRSDVRGLTPAARRALLAHDWPGNVRELRNVITRAMILEPTNWITPESLQLDLYAADGGGADGACSENTQFTACEVGDRLAADGTSPSATHGTAGPMDSATSSAPGPLRESSDDQRAAADASGGAGPGAILRPIAGRKDFSLETAEREFILRALKETGWQRTRAAALLGITRATLHAKLKRYEIQPPDACLPSDADSNEYEPLRA
jgi:DNA-binding NtrC family response regulator